MVGQAGVKLSNRGHPDDAYHSPLLSKNTRDFDAARLRSRGSLQTRRPKTMGPRAGAASADQSSVLDTWKSGHARSRAERTVGGSGHGILKAGSSWRKPTAAAGT